MPEGRWASGAADHTTNQRMELTAVLEAVQALGRPLHVISDSTYVVNCFRDRWWEGWIKRGGKNSQRKPVANRDLWEPLVEIVREGEITFEWVKGHAGDEWNDYADRGGEMYDYVRLAGQPIDIRRRACHGAPIGPHGVPVHIVCSDQQDVGSLVHGSFADG